MQEIEDLIVSLSKNQSEVVKNVSDLNTFHQQWLDDLFSVASEFEKFLEVNKRMPKLGADGDRETFLFKWWDALLKIKDSGQSISQKNAVYHKLQQVIDTTLMQPAKPRSEVESKVISAEASEEKFEVAFEIESEHIEALRKVLEICRRLQKFDLGLDDDEGEVNYLALALDAGIDICFNFLGHSERDNEILKEIHDCYDAKIAEFSKFFNSLLKFGTGVVKVEEAKANLTKKIEFLSNHDKSVKQSFNLESGNVTVFGHIIEELRSVDVMGLLEIGADSVADEASGVELENLRKSGLDNFSDSSLRKVTGYLQDILNVDVDFELSELGFGDCKDSQGFGTFKDFIVAAKELLGKQRSETQLSLDLTQIYLKDVGLSPDLWKSLKSVRIMTVYDLTQCTKARLYKVRNFGRKKLEEVVHLLETKYNTTLRED